MFFCRLLVVLCGHKLIRFFGSTRVWVHVCFCVFQKDVGVAYRCVFIHVFRGSLNIQMGKAYVTEFECKMSSICNHKLLAPTHRCNQTIPAFELRPIQQPICIIHVTVQLRAPSFFHLFRNKIVYVMVLFCYIY